MRVHPLIPATLAVLFVPAAWGWHPFNRLFLDPPSNERLALGMVLVLAIVGSAAAWSASALRRRWTATSLPVRFVVVAECTALAGVALLLLVGLVAGAAGTRPVARRPTAIDAFLDRRPGRPAQAL